MDRLDHRQLARLRLVPHAPHALDLTREMILARTEIAEADGIDVDAMHVGHRIDETPGHATP